MHDIRVIRDDPQTFDQQLKRLNYPPMATKLIAVDAKRRRAISESEAAKQERNALSKQAGLAKSQGNESEFGRLRDLVNEKKNLLTHLQGNVERLEREMRQLLLNIPNLPLPDVPEGDDESSNVECHQWGERRSFKFKPLEHFQIESIKSAMDFSTAAKLSGSRFVVLFDALARLHRALSQFMIDTHVDKHHLEEVWTPVLVRGDAMLGTGQLPKFATDSYRIADDFWLIPTAEVTLTNLLRDTIVAEDQLPRRYCAHTQCFRSEAGAAGRDTTGMLRQHQFEKVEMVTLSTPENSESEQQRMLQCAESILQALELPYRTVQLCTGDLGFSARRTYDIEVFLPGQNGFREISSVSTCGDFQARRMNARYRPLDGDSPQFLHTLNGSGLAVGRTVIAVLENGQQKDGSVVLPKILAPYLNDKTVIDRTGKLQD